jgi:hypothetical protein
VQRRVVSIGILTNRTEQNGRNNRRCNHERLLPGRGLRHLQCRKPIAPRPNNRSEEKKSNTNWNHHSTNSMPAIACFKSRPSPVTPCSSITRHRQASQEGQHIPFPHSSTASRTQRSTQDTSANHRLHVFCGPPASEKGDDSRSCRSNCRRISAGNATSDGLLRGD